jgi:serine/threonine protein kinase
VPFLALEWLEGEPLDRIIDRRAEAKNLFTLKEIVELLTPIARALARAHSFPGPNGSVAVVHCDMKPENIFVAQAGGEQQLKLVDFGIATAQSAATQAALNTDNGTLSSKPNATQMAFSPQYAAPEQWLPEKFGPTGPWTDVYGLALTLVEALIGRPPLEGEVSNMRALATDPDVRPTPKRFGLRLGQKVDRVFDRALAVDPRLRIRDVAELWTDLERAMGLEPSIRSARQAGTATTSERDRFSQSDLVVAAEERIQFDIEDVPPSRPGVLPQSLRPPSISPSAAHPSLTPIAPLAAPLSVAPGSLSRSGRYSRTDLQALAAEIHAPPPPPPKPLVPVWLVLASLALAGAGVALYMMGYKVWILPPALIVVLIGIYLARERD